MKYNTRTIGYWKNHSWNNVVITICGVNIDQILGQQILPDAQNNRFSMLISQLIAAKLNMVILNNQLPMPASIAAAEAWLCQQGVVNPQNPEWWNTKFASKEQKQFATTHKDILDYGNNNGIY